MNEKYNPERDIGCKLCNKKRPHTHKGCNEPSPFTTKVEWKYKK